MERRDMYTLYETDKARQADRDYLADLTGADEHTPESRKALARLVEPSEAEIISGLRYSPISPWAGTR